MDNTSASIIPQSVFTEPNTSEVINYLPATGYLIGIAINPLAYAELKCVLQDYCGSIVPDTEFYVGYAMVSGGIIFKEVLENFNNALPYRLKINKAHESSPPIPSLTMYPIGCLHG